jgi:hypothetical protein
MVVETEEPLDEEHHQEPDQQPPHDGADELVADRRHRPGPGQPLGALHPRVGQQVQHGDTQHDAGDEADQQLHAPVGEAHEQRHPASEKGRQNDQQAIQDQQADR